VRKLTQTLRGVYEKEIEGQFATQRVVEMGPSAKTISEELDEAASELAAKQKTELEKLKLQDLSQYVIKGAERDWESAVAGKKKKPAGAVSVKTGEKRAERSAVEMDIDDVELPVPKKVKGEKFKDVGKVKPGKGKMGRSKSGSNGHGPR